MVFTKRLKFDKNTRVNKHVGKGASEQVLPSRHAVQTLTQGDPMQRTMNQYAKATPLGNSDAESPDIFGD